MVTDVKGVREEYKKTIVGDIPIDWDVQPLGELAIIKARIGWRGLKASEYTNDGPYLVAGKHIKRSKIIWEECDHLSEERYKESPEIQLKPDDLILSKDGTIGRVAFIENLPGKATINGTMMLIRTFEDLYSKYAYYYLQGNHFQKLIKEKVSGSSIPHLFQRDMNNLYITIPTKQEQQKIAKILTTVDEAIESTVQLLEKTKELKKGLMQQLLTKGIGHTRFKQTELGEIPEGWEVRKQGDLSNFYNGRAYKQKEFKSEGTPIVRIQNLTGEREPVYSDMVLPDDKYIEQGDLIYAWSASFGPYIWKGPKSIYHYHIWKIKVNPKVLDKNFYYFRLDYISNEMNSQKNGSAFSHLTKGGMENHIIALPPLKEQKKIAEILLSLDEQIASYEEEKQRLNTLKKGLMQQLLTGKVRVTV